MDKNEDYLLKLLSVAIRGQHPPEPGDVLVDWEQIFARASAHEVHTLIYPVLKILSLEKQPPPHLMDRWEKATLISASRQLHYINEAYRVLQLFRNSGIPVIVLKGLFLRELYSEPELRTMGDIDLLIKLPDLDLATSLLITSGYVSKVDNGPIAAFSHSHCLNIELHYALFDSQRFINLCGFQKRVWERSIERVIGGQAVSGLSLEDDLVYLIAHMQSHFLRAGFGLRQVCDLLLFVETYGCEMDWKFFWFILRQTGYDGFAKAIFMIGRQYLGLRMTIPFLDGQETVDQESVIWLLQDIVSGGVYGRKSISRSMAGLVAAGLHGVGPVDKYDFFRSFWVFVSRVAFPGSIGAGERYAYAGKYPFLRPVAWVHRGCYWVYQGCFVIISRKYSISALLGILMKVSAMGIKRAQSMRCLKL